jgi:PKD repeat protein
MAYYLRKTNSDLTWGEDFDYKLLTTTAGEDTLAISLAKSATETSFGYTDLGIPNNADWETGTFTVKVKVTNNNSYIYGSIRVDRISAAGATVESSTTTAEQSFASDATYTFTVASKNWTAGTIGDRIAVAYIFRNSKSNAQSVTISLNTSESSVTTLVSTKVLTTKSLQYVIVKSVLILRCTITQYTTVEETSWTCPDDMDSVRYLVVAGGGNGGCTPYWVGGGGGSGGVLTGTQAATPGNSYTVIVGAGGTNHHGSNSKFDTHEATGGGQGKSVDGGSSADGGCGGGAGPYPYADTIPGTGIAGQGYDGGAWSGVDANDGGAGGGGAGAAGNPRTGPGPGANGGTGVSSDITGSIVWYGGGGGGGSGATDSGTSGSGGLGGGGAGATASADAVAGTANRGGGGGGASYYRHSSQAAGGSGIVILRWDGVYQLKYVILPLLPTIYLNLQYKIRHIRLIQYQMKYIITISHSSQLSLKYTVKSYHIIPAINAHEPYYDCSIQTTTISGTTYNIQNVCDGTNTYYILAPHTNPPHSVPPLALPWEVTVKCVAPIVVCGFSLTTWSINFPRDCTFDGSNNGASWTTLWSVTGCGSWPGTVTFRNTTPYLYYRLNVTKGQDDWSPYGLNIANLLLLTAGTHLTYAIKTPIRVPMEYTIWRPMTITTVPTEASSVPINCTAIMTFCPDPWVVTWNFDDPGPTGYVDRLTSIHQYQSAGTFDINASATSGGSTMYATPYAFVISVNTKPVAEWYPDTDFGLTPLTVTFYNYSSTYGGLANTYDWDFGDGTAHSSDTNPVHIFTSAATRTVTLTATNVNGSSTKSKYITIYSGGSESLPTADFEVISDVGLYYYLVTLTVTDVNGNTDTITKTVYTTPNSDFTKFRDLSTGKIKHWEWNFGDGNE